MLDSQVVAYLQAGREARGLALRLARLARGERRQKDIEEVENAAKVFKEIAEGRLRPRSTARRSVALATAEGLGVALHAAERRSSLGMDPLVEIAEALSRIASSERDLRQSADVLATASHCREFFEDVHDICHEVIALDVDSAPSTRLEQALAETAARA